MKKLISFMLCFVIAFCFTIFTSADTAPPGQNVIQFTYKKAAPDFEMKEIPDGKVFVPNERSADQKLSAQPNRVPAARQNSIAHRKSAGSLNQIRKTRSKADAYKSPPVGFAGFGTDNNPRGKI